MCVCGKGEHSGNKAKFRPENTETTTVKFSVREAPAAGDGGKVTGSKHPTPVPHFMLTSKPQGSFSGDFSPGNSVLAKLIFDFIVIAKYMDIK